MNVLAQELVKLDDIRLIALKIAYSIPGYAEAGRETKNFIYDAIKDALTKEEKPMTMREWARQNGLEDRYNQYLEECRQISDQCAEEGYQSHGSNYELRVADLEQDYPDLFGEDDEDEDRLA